MRRLFAIGSVAGAPGATTVALALAAAWPRDADGGVRPVVIEAGIWGGDLAARFGLPHTPGLLDVAAAVRQSHPGSLLGAVHELPFGVRAVLATAERGPCTEAVRLLSTPDGPWVLRGETRDQGSVLVDVGRITVEPQGLLETADEVLLVARGGAESLAHVYAHRSHFSAFAGRLRLLVVGPCPYGPEEISTALGVERVTLLPWDAKTAVVLNGSREGRLPAGGFRTPPLMAAAGKLAEQMSSQPSELPLPSHTAAVAEGSDW
ncbi:hypothetical protein DVA86_27750 [Streptomyces armeniacus]|uniref:Uncharacterized protein n=1 Tax=Streptomyces armeniacus TaxID=83291 RepID=A0A345XW38_9ACTN|nr:hypothetical protein [Streptomyces armeniacus]AXK35854.1 hypothetical protein DVA86_27750 [Streptomyces armeniacus]